MSSPTLPTGYSRIKVVGSFDELVATPFSDGINALCWPRTLAGNFHEIVEQVGAGEGITALDAERLGNLVLSPAGRAAREILLEDLELLRIRGLAPELNCIQAYPRDEEVNLVRTDVYSFHADSAPVAADTYLCTYVGAASEGLRNDEARRRIDIPETRAELLKLFGGDDNAEFHDYLSENCYDLHYASVPNAQPFSFGLGHLWRIAIDYPGNPVPPCVHRAPENLAGQSPRLLLIS